MGEPLLFHSAPLGSSEDLPFFSTPNQGGLAALPWVVLARHLGKETNSPHFETTDK